MGVDDGDGSLRQGAFPSLFAEAAGVGPDVAVDAAVLAEGQECGALIVAPAVPRQLQELCGARANIRAFDR